MTSFLLRKIRNNKWLMLCLILGNIILIATVSVVPLFIAATNQRLFQDEFRKVQEEENMYPALVHFRFTFNSFSDEIRFYSYTVTKDTFIPQAVSRLGIPVHLEIPSYIISSTKMQPLTPREDPVRNRAMQISAPRGFEENVRLLHGRMPSGELITVDGITDGYVMEALATSEVMYTYDLLLDEIMELENIYGDDGSKLYVRITGIFDLAGDSDEYWSVSLMHLRGSLFISNNIFSEHFLVNYIPQLTVNAHWVQALDWQAMRADSIPRYVQAIEYNKVVFNDENRVRVYEINFGDIIDPEEGDIDSSEGEANRLNTIVWVLQIPIYIMLALFMYMVTKQILVIDSNDISVLKSRGVSRRQLLGIYALQGLFVAVISFPAGLGLGMVLCRIIGTSGGFLELADRTTLNVMITGQTLIYASAGMIISFLYMLVPVIRLSKTGIVEHKRQRAGKSNKPLWEKYYLDIIAFAASIYMLYNFNIQRELIMTTFQEERAFDPLMFFGSSLFIIGTALLLLRLYPYFMKLVLLIGRRKFGPAIYAAVVKVSRSGGGEQMIMLFLVFTVAVGIFSAQSARTLNRNNEHRIRYLGISDVMIREVWEDNLLTREQIERSGFDQPAYLIYTEPDFDRFLEFEEVTAITRILEQKATVTRAITNVDNVRLLGIETNSFGETIWFRRDLTPIHINYFLNVLALNPDGVLLSSNFRKLGYEIDGTIKFRAPQRHGPDMEGDLNIIGFFDYWPSYRPISIQKLDTGEVAFTDNYLAIANFAHLNSLIGIRPYNVLMRTDGASHEFIYDFKDADDIIYDSFYDNDRALSDILADPVIQSTNGFMSVGFILTMLLCFTGFLIYWVLSIKERLLQFGVFRAMGMGMRGIIGILICEQALITIVALAIGGIVGEVASRFYVPLLQISYTAADQIIPLVIVKSPMDFITIYSILGFMLVLSIIVLVRYTLRINVTQVLKLGED